MIRLIGWLAVLAFLYYTGILQAVLIFTGAMIVWLGAALGSIGGAL